VIQPNNTDPPQTITLWPLADHRHLYMIVAGILLGVILGPAVLGRLAPKAYDSAFVGSGDTTEFDAALLALEEFKSDISTREQKIRELIEQYEAVGEPGDSIMVAQEEHKMRLINGFAEEEVALNATVEELQVPILFSQSQHAEKLAGLATLLLLALGVVFAIESIMGPASNERDKTLALPPMLARLVTVRYALMASWLTLMIAQPAPLRRIADHAAFAVILIAVIVVVGFVPLGKRAAE